MSSLATKIQLRLYLLFQEAFWIDDSQGPLFYDSPPTFSSTFCIWLFESLNSLRACVCVCVCVYVYVLSTVKLHFKVFLVPFFYKFKTLPLHSGCNTSIQLIHCLNRDIDGESPQTIPNHEILVLSAEACSETPVQTHTHTRTRLPSCLHLTHLSLPTL